MSGMPEWRRHAIKVYYMPYGTTEEKSVVLCPDHRIEFYQGQPSAQGRGEEFPLTDCEICSRKVRFETTIVRKGE